MPGGQSDVSLFVCHGVPFCARVNYEEATCIPVHLVAFLPHIRVDSLVQFVIFDCSIQPTSGLLITPRMSSEGAVRGLSCLFLLA